MHEGTKHLTGVHVVLYCVVKSPAGPSGEVHATALFWARSLVFASGWAIDRASFGQIFGGGGLSRASYRHQ